MGEIRRNKRNTRKAQKQIDILVKKFENEYAEKYMVIEGALIITEELETKIIEIDKAYRSYIRNFNSNPKNSVKLEIDWFTEYVFDKIREDKQKYWMQEATAYLKNRYAYEEYHNDKLLELYNKGISCHDAAIQQICEI